jgi:hypothetical protein
MIVRQISNMFDIINLLFSLYINIMRTFNEYAFEKDKKELLDFLIENKINIDQLDIKLIIESGWWDRNKQNLKKGMQKAALLAAMPGMMGNMFSQPKEMPQAQPYRFQSQRLMINQQAENDDQADKAYVNAGGPEYKQTLEDAQEFAKFQTTPQHKQILSKAGLPSNYIPGTVRKFAYGEKISTISKLNQESATVIQNKIQKQFGRDSFVEIVSVEDTVTGGKQILLEINGIVMGLDESDAISRAKTIIEQIAKSEGYSLEGFKDMSKSSNDTTVSRAQRSTIDYVPENNGKPIRFKVRVKLISIRSA